METNVTDEQLAFKHPARIYVCGPTTSGKTSLVMGIIQHRKKTFDKEFSHIFYCHPEEAAQDHELFVDKLKSVCPSVTLVAGLPNFEEISYLQGPKLIFLDDLILDLVNSEQMYKTMTIYSNHSSMSLILTSQNLYLQGKFSKSLLRNASYLIIFNSMMDQLLLAHLSRQIFPGEGHKLVDIMKWVSNNMTKNYEKYICIDSSPLSTINHDLRIKTRILPDESGLYEPIFLS